MAQARAAPSSFEQSLEQLTADQRARLAPAIEELARVMHAEDVRVLAEATYDNSQAVVAVALDRIVVAVIPIAYLARVTLDLARDEIDEAQSIRSNVVIQSAGRRIELVDVQRKRARDIARLLQPDEARERSRTEALRGELEALKDIHQARLKVRNARVLGAAATCVIVAVLLLLVGHDSSTWLAVLALATVFALVTICGSDWYASLFMRRRPGVQRDPRRLMPLNEIRAALREIENDVDLEGIGEQSPKLRAEKLFKLHQYELKRYYDQTLRHSSAIFIVGIVCMFLGFAIIVASLVLLRDLPENAGTTTKIVIGALGAIGAILANFIGAIYMTMFSRTLQSLTDFHGRLVETHHLHFGNFLAANIEDAQQRDATRAAIAAAMAHQRAADSSNGVGADRA